MQNIYRDEKNANVSTSRFSFNGSTKADPFYNKSGNAQILFGVETWSDVIQSGVIQSESGLCAQETTFGYQIFGSMYEQEAKQNEKSKEISSTRVTIDENSFCN